MQVVRGEPTTTGSVDGPHPCACPAQAIVWTSIGRCGILPGLGGLRETITGKRVA